MEVADVQDQQFEVPKTDMHGFIKDDVRCTHSLPALMFAEARSKS